TMRNGALIKNVAAFNVHMPQDNTNRIEYTISGGSKLFCKGIIFGATWNQNYHHATNMIFTLRGVPGAKPENQTALDLGGGQFQLGKRHDGNCHANDLTLHITDGARVQNSSWLGITHEIGGVNNKILIDKDAQVSCGGFIIGGCGFTNLLEITGAGTVVNAGNGNLHIGDYKQKWGAAVANGARVSDGASLLGLGQIFIGRTRTEYGDSDHDNYLLVTGGAALQSKSAHISHAGPVKGGASYNNRLRVEGRGTSWDLCGGYILCGHAEEGPSVSNTVYIVDGAVVSNVVYSTVGSVLWSTSIGNRLILANGARIISKNEIKVGETISQHVHGLAEDNSILIAGGKLGAAIWDMGDGTLSIGTVLNQDSPSRGNKVILQPEGHIINAGAIVIGNGRGTRVGNALVLAGGSISGKSLHVSKDNGIEALVTKTGIKPILIEGDIAIEDGAYIYPRSSTGAAAPSAGRHTVIAWKGNAPDIAKLKLHPKTDSRKWKLEIDNQNKRLILFHTP
ncbi:MAG: hypothetical protein FWG05_06500, partial [Kiritimatiellaeota bacterium]|nr:hypothetical protein [Kiritimatiellota bacterium]